jgi:tRNA pseudouridine55 synthase|tara:strand:+ start:3455 stop:4222 length:768 start_codon:yes stop_codon:yes gene_type:complete
LGEATKFSQFLLDSDKRYVSTFILGVATDTGDSDGEVLDVKDASNITEGQVELAIEGFKGDIKQVPSMYSALKHNGQPLYRLARKGITIDREPRDITVFQYQVLDFRSGPKAELDVEVHVSKGTYVRSLAEDLGAIIGCGAHVSSLRRHLAGPFNDSQCVTLEDLSRLRENDPSNLDGLLKPMDIAVADFMAVELSSNVSEYFQLGQAVMSNQAFRNGQEGDIVRVFRQDGSFLGIGEVTRDGQVAPKRLVVGVT